MKEIEPQTLFINKIINCDIHNRSFQIEKGDELISKPVKFITNRGSRIINYFYIKLPCGCEVKVE